MTEDIKRLVEGSELLSDGLVRFRGMLWSRGHARKRARCWLTAAQIVPGDAVYRPISNGADRMRRICATVWDQPLASTLKEMDHGEG